MGDGGPTRGVVAGHLHEKGPEGKAIRISAHPLGGSVTLQQLRIDLFDKLLLNIELPFDQSSSLTRKNILRLALGDAKKMRGKSGQIWRFLLHTKSLPMTGFTALF